MNLTSSWLFWAVLSAVFAALTAIFAKVGVENINSDLATFIRTLVVIAALGLLLAATGKFQSPGAISPRSYLFLVLSGLGTGAAWLCYFRALKLGDAAKVAPIDNCRWSWSPRSACSFSVSGWPRRTGSASRWSRPGAILVAYR